MPAKTRNLLTDRALRAATEPGRHVDGGGLYLDVRATGRFWRLKYRAAGRERLISLGEYPAVSLRAARERADEYRVAAAAGRDLYGERQAARAAVAAEVKQARARSADMFGAWADRYYAAHESSWSATHQRDVRRILAELKDGHVAGGKRLSEGMGAVPVPDLEKRHLLAVVDGAIARGARVHADDLLTYAQAVVRHFNGRQERGAKVALDNLDAAGIREQLPRARPAKSMAALPLGEVPEFLRRLHFDSTSTPRIRRATRLLLLTGARTVELRHMCWEHVDLAGAVWTIPAERMKYRTRVWAEHMVPLSRQARALLADLAAEREALAGDDPRRATPLVFYNERDVFAPISENTVLACIAGIGYARRQTGHGFRGLISTWANREGINRDAIERQLAHVEADRVRGAYNKWEFWPERVDLAQRWADQLDAWLAQAMHG